MEIAGGQKSADAVKERQVKATRAEARGEFAVLIEAAARGGSAVVGFGADLSGAKLDSLRLAASSESRDEASMRGNVRRPFKRRAKRHTWCVATWVKDGYEAAVGISMDRHLSISRSPGEEEARATKFDENKVRVRWGLGCGWGEGWG